MRTFSQLQIYVPYVFVLLVLVEDAYVHLYVGVRLVFVVVSSPLRAWTIGLVRRYHYAKYPFHFGRR